MAKASDNLFPKVLLVEGAAPASPAAGNQGLFIDSADHKLKRVNSSGTVTTVEGGGSGTGAVPTTYVIKTAGSYSINNTSWTNLDTSLDLTIAAAVGDIIEVALSAYVKPASTAEWASLDAVTVVAGAAVNSLSSGTATPPSNGFPGWNISGARNEGPVSGSVYYTVQSGDLSSGNVTIRLRYKTANAQTATVRAQSSDPLHFSVKNLRH